MAGVVWFRRDLRLRDNPAWAAATAEHDEVVALFVIDAALFARASERRRALLVGHLHALDRALAELGGRLRVLEGDPVAAVVATVRAEDTAYWNDDHTPYARRRDEAVAAALARPPVRHHGLLVHRPGSVTTASGSPYRVFTPFYRRWVATPVADEPAPGSARVAADVGAGLPADVLDGSHGEDAALARLRAMDERIDRYDESRDRPDLDETSHLSADLKFGTISPRRVLRVIGTGSAGREAFVRQLCWRDFYAHLLRETPSMTTRAMDERFERVRWRDNPEELEAWASGQTGYPIVDAGMRQLLREGWMHNRVRLITASFLVKDLLVDWRLGERHFRHRLLDGDTASNVGNWQWVAGTGTDAAPYFRVLNPVRQATRFDPDGAYTRRYVPELADVPTRYLHAPWTAGPERLESAGVVLGVDYPEPIVDHAAARERALAAYSAAKEEAAVDDPA